MTTQERETYLLDISDYNAEGLLAALSERPIQGLILKCAQDRRLDLGALCYANRQIKSRKIPKPVETSSLTLERCAAMKSWCVEYISKVYLGGSPYTLYADALSLAAQVNWCDTNGHRTFMSRDSAYKQALDGYTQNLILSMRKDGGIGAFSANRLQSAAIQNSSLFFPNSPINFLNNLPIIPFGDKEKGEREPTLTPSEQEMTTYLTACQYIFDGITDFLLNGLPFPHCIPYMETEALLLPSRRPITTIHVASSAIITKSLIWDYSTGSIAKIDEIFSLSSQRRDQLVKQINNAHAFLDNANENLHHPKRTWLASFAQDAFYSLFVANTAINDAPLRKYKWNDDYTIINSDTAGFVTIKHRAGNLEQRFDIQKTFVKHFKKYLKLRAYLCSSQPVEYLFPCITRGKIRNISTKGNSVKTCNLKITTFLDPNFKFLTHRQLRKYKPVYLLAKNYPTTVVAAIIQNNAETVLGHYSEAEEKTAIDEIASTLSFVTLILERGSKLEIPSGGCSGNAISEAETAPEHYEPNCKNFVGCIYCNEFRLHADEDSIRKLLSMRYVTAERVSSCTDVNQFEALHGNVLSRIDDILAELAVKRPDLKPVIDRVRQETEQDCNLSPYWDIFYERLIKLKIIK